MLKWGYNFLTFYCFCVNFLKFGDNTNKKYSFGVTKMKTRLIVLLSCVVITVITCTALFSVKAEPSKEPNITSSRQETVNFTLAVWGNNAALFDGGQVIEIYDDIIVSSLPPADQTALEQGITITSFDQLESLLEDFDG